MRLRKTMDYKFILKSRELRLKILRFLSFVPDKQMLKLQYRIKMGRKLNLKKPQRYTEKIQWYKLYYKSKLMIQCVDKYEVREYLVKKGFFNLLPECFGVYESVSDIDFDILPERFVIKDTLAGGGTSVIIVNDKRFINIEKVKEKIVKWLSVPCQKDGGREWPYYSGKKHRIIIEENLSSKTGEDLLDYKFFCFNGKVSFIYVMGNRKLGKSVCASIFDRDFKQLAVKRAGDNLLSNVIKPENYEVMVRIAEQLSVDFPHVRVDLYNNNGVIKFGELTFYNASGYMKYDPDSFDYYVGKEFVLPTNTK